MMLLLLLLLAPSLTTAKLLPSFPPNWSVHEHQYANVGGQLRWSGTVYNDAVPTPHPFCKRPTSSKTPNCTFTAYVDDTKQRSSYYFYEPTTAARGIVYFTQPTME